MKLTVKNLLLYSDSEREINFSLQESTMIQIDSACGKTSLFNALAYQKPPFSGEILLNDTALYKESDYGDSLPEKSNIGEVGVVFSKHALISNLSLIENIELVLLNKNSELSEREKRDKVIEHLKRSGLHAFVEKRPFELTTSQLKLASFVRAAIHEPSLLVWDDPFFPTDKKAAAYLVEEIKTMSQKGNLLIAIGSDSNIAQQLSIPIHGIDPERLSA
jgi:ABC-type lipoprotein export system ATPase subunit